MIENMHKEVHLYTEHDKILKEQLSLRGGTTVILIIFGFFIR